MKANITIAIAAIASISYFIRGFYAKPTTDNDLARRILNHFFLVIFVIILTLAKKGGQPVWMNITILATAFTSAFYLMSCLSAETDEASDRRVKIHLFLYIVAIILGLIK